jgi:hypothetical protein
LNKRYSELQSLFLWEGSGVGHYYRMDIDGEFKLFLTSQIKEAIRVKQERRRESSRRELLKSLRDRGCEIAEELPGYDENDLVGLIGEIVINDFAVNLGVEPILPKWHYTGTSKSSGIDFVGREKLGDMWELALYEAKHLHDEVRNTKTECYTLIKGKFRIGLDEFESEKTELDLASILLQLENSIRLCKAIESDASSIQEYRAFISSSLQNNRYRLNVVALVDTEYCSETTFEQSISKMPNPLEVGKNHPVSLNLIKAKSLEKTTNEVCEIYVGTI